MASIIKRGPHQFQAKIRRGDYKRSETFETRKAARDWAARIEAKLDGNEHVDPTRAKSTTLREALIWYRDHGMAHNKPNAKNERSKINYWLRTEFASWSIVSLKSWDLIAWRRRVLDEDGADDGESVGPEAECSAQTATHRLNLLSQVYQRWGQAHEISLANPVGKGVRPSASAGRDRRLDPHQDTSGVDEEERMLAALRSSSRKWLADAAVIAVETCLRQTELAELTWDRVRLDGKYPFAQPDKTKNKWKRRTPLSARAVSAFRELVDGGEKPRAGKVLPIESGNAIGQAFRSVITDEAFPDLRWHDLRHEAISRLFETTDLRDTEIMAISGHLTPSMLARYTHLRGNRLAPRLNGSTSPVPRLAVEWNESGDAITVVEFRGDRGGRIVELRSQGLQEDDIRVLEDAAAAFVAVVTRVAAGLPTESRILEDAEAVVRKPSRRQKLAKTSRRNASGSAVAAV
ncbi:site-specific integrase [Inquilinus sp. CAU 1745]|uniref:site-specific integrase n=1 Tax=Inquilinus sp. CAU 1745 TaxID=3140369 RepID=UPI00325B92C8